MRPAWLGWFVNVAQLRRGGLAVKTRIALVAVTVCAIVGLTPAAAGAQPTCVEQQIGPLHLQVGYCP
jgi:hypothetical protein